MSEPAVCPLDDWGVLRFSGPDARKFLHGQLSNDVANLPGGVLLRAGLHNPQGRTLALLMLAVEADDALLAMLPHELMATTVATLKRYVLRARVSIGDESAAYRIHGLTAAGAPPAGTTTSPAAPQASPAGARMSAAAAGAGCTGAFAYEGARHIVIARAGDGAPAGAPLARAEWRALDIAEGVPQLYLPTSGQFVAQMLNLDCIGAISFTKGCYTGQEVIARAHYRGRVKRRMQRFISSQPLRLVPGDAGRLSDGRGFRVIEAVEREGDRVEFLAVAALPGAPAEPEPTGPAPPSVEATALPLPYPLPS